MSPKDRFWHGFVVLVLGHLAQVALFVIVAMLDKPGTGPLPNSFFVMIGFGLTQLLYVVPATLFFLVTKRWRAAGALFVGAVLTGLLNLVVWLLIASGGPLVP